MIRAEQKEKLWLQKLQGRHDRNIRETVKSLKKEQTLIVKLQRDLAEACSREMGYEAKLRQLENSLEDQHERWLLELRNLMKSPDFKDFEIHDTHINFFTNMIFCDRRAKSSYQGLFEMGEYRMEVYTSGDRRGQVKFFNLTRQSMGYGGTSGCHHPHVEANGRPCLGTIKTAVSEYIGKQMYSVVFYMSVQYLKTVNTDDVGKDIKYWPQVDTDEKTDEGGE